MKNNDQKQYLEELIEDHYFSKVGYPYYVCEGLQTTHKTPIIHMGEHCPICREFKAAEMHNSNELRDVTIELIQVQEAVAEAKKYTKELKDREDLLYEALDELAAFRAKSIELFPELGI